MMTTTTAQLEELDELLQKTLEVERAQQKRYETITRIKNNIQLDLISDSGYMSLPDRAKIIMTLLCRLGPNPACLHELELLITGLSALTDYMKVRMEGI
jgi:hypothetical protein